MVRTRFAPSPTGYLHIGGLRTALYAYLFAKQNNGKFILRIEDTDTERYVEGAVEIIYRTLKEAGLVYDEGPDVGGDFGPYIQSERKALYLPYAEQLIENGSAYYCFCSKERLNDLHAQGATKYDKHCCKIPLPEARARVAAGEPHVIRQNIPEGVSRYTDLVFGEIVINNSDLEDNILVKSDGMPTYNFANVIDDRLMNVTHIIRGNEYLSSTPKYNLIYQGLGWEIPKYIHLQPIMRDARNKLSKRHGDASYEDFIKKGYLKEAVVNYIALLGWSPKDMREKFSLEEMIQLFSLDGLSKSASIFDENKMRWLNSQYVKELPVEQFHEYALPWYEKSCIKGRFDYLKASKLLASRTEIFSDIPVLLEFIDNFENYDTALFVNQRQKCDLNTAREVLPKALEALEKSNFENLHDELMQLAPALGVKTGQLLWPLRIAITGHQSTPGGATEMADFLGKDEVVRRLKYSIGYIKA